MVNNGAQTLHDETCANPEPQTKFQFVSVELKDDLKLNLFTPIGICDGVQLYLVIVSFTYCSLEKSSYAKLEKKLILDERAQ